MRIITVFKIFLIYVFFLASAVAAEEIAFEIKLQRDRLSPGKQVNLTATLPDSVDIPAPSLPFIDGLDIKYVKKIKMPAGTGMVGFVYRVAALKKGNFKIGPVELYYKGVTYRSNIVTLIVEKELAAPGSTVSRPAKEEFDLSTHIYLNIEVPNRTIYVNENLPVIVKLYSDWLDLENISIFQDQSKDLVVKEFGDRQVNIITKDGVKYAVLEYHSSLFAVIPGEYTLTPIKMKLDIVRPKKDPGGAEPEILNNNVAFYEELLGPDAARTVEVKAEPGTITALSVPRQAQKTDRVADELKERVEEEEVRATEKGAVALAPQKISVGAFSVRGIRFYRNPIIIFFMVFPFFAAVGSIAIKRRILFLEEHPHYAALLSASKKAHSAIAQLENSVKHQDPGSFYESILQILQGYLAVRSFLPPTAVTEKTVRDLPFIRDEKELEERICRIFSLCYLASYGKAKPGRDAMDETVKELSDVIKELNKRHVKE